MSRQPAAPVMPIYKVTIPALGEKMQTPAWQDVQAHPGSLGPTAALMTTSTGKPCPRGPAHSTPARDPLPSKNATLSLRQLDSSSSISEWKGPREREPWTTRSDPPPPRLTVSTLEILKDGFGKNKLSRSLKFLFNSLLTCRNERKRPFFFKPRA